jgi:hypothetical protein
LFAEVGSPMRADRAAISPASPAPQIWIGRQDIDLLDVSGHVNRIASWPDARELKIHRDNLAIATCASGSEEATAPARALNDKLDSLLCHGQAKWH